MTNRKRTFLMMFVFSLLVMLPQLMVANSAEPPGITVIILNPPEDVSISLLVNQEGVIKTFPLQTEHRLWETYYRYYYAGSSINSETLEQGSLRVITKEKEVEIALSGRISQTYRNVMTLDLQQEELHIGTSWIRNAILVIIRMGLTLLLEGFVFWVFGYREKRSWKIFLIINVVTQSALNMMIHGPEMGSYFFILFIMAEAGILLFETLGFLFFLHEESKWRTFAFAVMANLFSLTLGGYLLLLLPL